MYYSMKSSLESSSHKNLDSLAEKRRAVNRHDNKAS